MSFSDRFRRTATARGKAELADMAADHAREDSDIARTTAKQFAPDFQQLGNIPELVTRCNPFQNFGIKCKLLLISE
jgi:junctophilin